MMSRNILRGGGGRILSRAVVRGVEFVHMPRQARKCGDTVALEEPHTVFEHVVFRGVYAWHGHFFGTFRSCRVIRLCAFLSFLVDRT